MCEPRNSRTLSWDWANGLGLEGELWRKLYEDWGGLGLVGAWEFWMRLELLGWNPFEVSLLPYFKPLSLLESHCWILETWMIFFGILPCTSIHDFNVMTCWSWVLTET